MSIYGNVRILIAPRGFSIDEQGKLKREKGQAPTRAPVQDDLAARQTKAKAEAVARRKEERGFIGELVDRVFGSEPEAPKAYTRTELADRQKEINAERQRLAASAAEFDRLAARASKENQGRAGAEAFAAY